MVVAAEDDFVGAAARPLRRPQLLLEGGFAKEINSGGAGVEAAAFSLDLLDAVDEWQRFSLLDRIFSVSESKGSVVNLHFLVREGDVDMFRRENGGVKKKRRGKETAHNLFDEMSERPSWLRCAICCRKIRQGRFINKFIVYDLIGYFQ